MKALTLYQPYAWAIAHSTKRIENRDWCDHTAIGADIAIHASEEMPLDYYWEAAFKMARRGVLLPGINEMVRGAIVAIAHVQHIVHASDRSLLAGRIMRNDWWIGPYGWILTDVRTLKTPVICSGAKRLWPVSKDLEVRIRKAL